MMKNITKASREVKALFDKGVKRVRLTVYEDTRRIATISEFEKVFSDGYKSVTKSGRLSQRILRHAGLTNDTEYRVDEVGGNDNPNEDWAFEKS